MNCALPARIEAQGSRFEMEYSLVTPSSYLIPILALWLLTVSGPALGAEPAHHNPTSLADTPLDECTPQTVLGWTYGESLGRDADNATQVRFVLEKMQALVKELPPGKEKIPLGQQMTPEQSARFAELSAQVQIYRYSHLAESRLQRDEHIIGLAIDAIEKLQGGPVELKSKDDTDAGQLVVGLLRAAPENESQNKIDPTNASVCSLDFALYLKEQAAFAAVHKHLALKETAELKELIAKYKITGPLDPSKLPSPDREKAIWLQKAVAEPAQRILQALRDWQNLRRFVTVSRLKYSMARDAIITGAGSKDYDYDKKFKKSYDEADPVMKQTMDAWTAIDQAMPSDAAKEEEDLAKISKGAQAGKN
jgi:hypothetical protein